ncbi:MAG: hypothetical protein BZ137_09255 [Methanosphaera sp. rholeuAM130]|nr:MAG: hypothetical protein BZ137_09255 [Methanosphaera sp. rholeuAM130]
MKGDYMHNNNIDNNFFIIASDNLEEVTSQLYGYILVDNEIITKSSLNDDVKLPKNGCYVNIRVKEDEIEIAQDINASYGLYLYQNQDYFAISNSFLYLVEYLKDKYPLTFNEDYALAFLSTDLVSIAYKQTIINEISSISPNKTVYIDKETKQISMEKVLKEYKTISIDSKEGIELLDSWFYSWVNFIRELKSKTNNIRVDLSGGIDSRIIFGLIISSNINLDEIYINTYTDNLHTHKEDYEIASEICSRYDIDINKQMNLPIEFYDEPEPILDISFYTKLSFHKQMYYKPYKQLETSYSFKGFGGENIRQYWNHSPQEHKKWLNKLSSNYAILFNSATQKILDSNFESLKEEYSVESNDLTKILYREVRSPNHFGKSSVESFLSDEIVISPLLDFKLSKLKLSAENIESDNLLLATIFNRYFPELLSFKFDNNKSIDTEAIKYSEKINEKYPFIENNLEVVSNDNLNNKIRKIQKTITSNINSTNYHTDYDDTFYINQKDIIEEHEDEINNYLKKIVSSKAFENYFKTYFPSSYYNKMLNHFYSRKYYPLQSAHAAISVALFKHITEYNKDLLSRESIGWLTDLSKEVIITENQNNVYLEYLDKYNTCRLDIKNKGNPDNDYDIVYCSDCNTYVEKPNWYNTNDGVGRIFLSSNNSLKLQIVCINDGNLEINIRSVDFKDSENKAIPIYIDYERFIVDSEVIFDNGKVIWHNQPFKFSKDVKDGQIVNISLFWKPLNKFSLLEQEEK